MCRLTGWQAGRQAGCSQLSGVSGGGATTDPVSAVHCVVQSTVNHDCLALPASSTFNCCDKPRFSSLGRPDRPHCCVDWNSSFCSQLQRFHSRRTHPLKSYLIVDDCCISTPNLMDGPTNNNGERCFAFTRLVNVTFSIALQ